MSDIKFEKRLLTLDEAVQFINLATEICFDNDGKYIPIMRELCIPYAVLQFLSDYDPMSKTIEEVYSVIYQKDVQDFVMKEVFMNDGQMCDILKTVGEIIDNRKKKSEEPYTISTAILDYLQGKSSPVIAGLIEQLAGIGNEIQLVEGGYQPDPNKEVAPNPPKTGSDAKKPKK